MLTRFALNKRSIPLVLLVLLVGLSALGGSPQAAKAATLTSKSAVPFSNCRVIGVHLHGNDPATSTCLQSKQIGVSPNIYSSQCTSAAVQLWIDANYGDFELCFYDTGLANLTDYCLVFGTCSGGSCGQACNGVNWNDQVSSFKTGWNYGYFYQDINGGRASLVFSPNENCPHINSLTHTSWSNPSNFVWNDQMSSLRITGVNPSAPAITC